MVLKPMSGSVLTSKQYLNCNTEKKNRLTLDLKHSLLKIF